MKLYYKKLLIELLSVISAPCVAQQVHDISHSNNSGLTGVLWNPGTIVSNNYKLQILASAVDINFSNTAFRYSGTYNIYGNNEQFSINDRTVAYTSSKKYHNFSSGVDVRGPGIMLSLKNNSGFAFTSRLRLGFQGNAISNNLIQRSITGFQEAEHWRKSSLNLNANSFSEYSFSYGRNLLFNGNRTLRAGITLKKLSGIGSAHLDGQNIDYSVSNLNESSAVPDSLFTLNNFSGSYKYANPSAFRNIDIRYILDGLLAKNSFGSGFGIDIGAVYDHNAASSTETRSSENNNNNYLYRVGISVVDIGYIRYKTKSAAYNLDIKNKKVNNDDLSQIYFTNFDNKLYDILNLDNVSGDTNFTAYLPAAVHLDLDFHYRPHLYFNTSINQSLQPRYSTGMRSISYISFSPRYESKFLDFSTPISIINNYQQVVIGGTIRIGNLTIGSNNLLWLISSSDPYGASIFAETSLLKLTSNRGKAQQGK